MVYGSPPQLPGPSAHLHPPVDSRTPLRRHNMSSSFLAAAGHRPNDVAHAVPLPPPVVLPPPKPKPQAEAPSRSPKPKVTPSKAVSSETAKKTQTPLGWPPGSNVLRERDLGDSLDEQEPQGGRPKGALAVGGASIALVVTLQALATMAAPEPPPPPSPDVGSTIDAADTSWMLVATALVLVMMPGLGLFEAGLLRAKNSVSVLMQVFAGLSILSILWFTVGFSLCFSTTDYGLYGSLEHLLLIGITTSPFPAAPTIPGDLFVAFQGMFATITPLLCTGAFAERLKFEAFVAFAILWSLVVYYPLCHLIWGGGWLSQIGVVDFAGGIVIHTSAGVASLVTAIKLGPRNGFNGLDSSSLAPHNLPMAAVGAGLLWAGWFGFNAGSALTTGGVASSTLLTTHIAGSTGTLIWLVLDWVHVGKPTFVGVINGALSGLAGVTPASGFVTPVSGAAIGLICGVSSYAGVLLFKEYLRIDDALDVSSVHGVTGVVGSLLIGIYASEEVNGIEAGPAQLGAQAIGVLVAMVWSAIGTSLVMNSIEAVMGITRVGRDEERKGLDRSHHGESSYLDLHALV